MNAIASRHAMALYLSDPEGNTVELKGPPQPGRREES
jgi:hypothetical protein